MHNPAAETGGLFEPGGLFDDAPMEHVSMESGTIEGKTAARTPRREEKKQEDSDDDDDYYGTFFYMIKHFRQFGYFILMRYFKCSGDMGPPSMGAPSSGRSSPATPAPLPTNVDELNDQEPQQQTILQPPQDLQTTLIQNEEETFALAPLEASVIQGTCINLLVHNNTVLLLSV